MAEQTDTTTTTTTVAAAAAADPEEVDGDAEPKESMEASVLPSETVKGSVGEVNEKGQSPDKSTENNLVTTEVNGDATDSEESAEGKVSNESSTKVTEQSFSDAHDYELIDGKYYYTDTASGKRYRYEEESGEWVDVGDNTHNTERTDDRQTTTDSEGRTYYYADGYYLCHDSDGNVFYLSEGNEWKPWADRDSKDSSAEHKESKWYFYQGDSTFYRDNTSGAVYRLNKDENKWEKYEGKLRKKRPRIDDEEEFDTDEDEGSDDESAGGAMPPGAQEDPNISYDGTTYTKVDPSDNMVYEWDVTRRAWFPKIDEDFMATYQMSYGFKPDGTKDENPVKYDDEKEEEERLRAEEERKKAEEKKAAKLTKKKPTWFEMDETSNTKVYVSNLPDSMTEAQFITLMQKCGMILFDEETKKPKVKLYKDKQGNFKGDALCTYIKVESVKLAEQILDDYQVGNQKIHVEPAKFQQKGQYDPKLKPRKKRKKEIEKLQKKQEKLFDWRPEPMRGQRMKHENTVVIRNVFTPNEFEVAMDKILDHKEAMRSQASNFGKIKKLELYDLHPEGVVQVTFEEVESADMCVATLNKRLYVGRTLYVSTWDGKEKFKIQETDAEREERIKKWNEFLESETSQNSIPQ